MAMPDLRKVRQVLRTKLLTLAGIPSVIAYENRAVDPPLPGNLWLAEHMLPGGEPKVATGMVESRGVFQVDVLYSRGMGTEKAEDMAKGITELFHPGTSLQGQGVNVAIDRTDRNSGREWDELWWFIPIQVSWRTYSFT